MITSLRIVAATRASPSEAQRIRLAQSLPQLVADARIKATVSCNNKRGLSKVYNDALRAAPEDEVLLFTHDDVFINDFLLLDRLAEAFKHYDIIGVAGCNRPDAHQVGWAFWRNGAEKYWYEPERLSGTVAHTTEQGVVLNVFGPAPQECQLLDGCFLAARVRDLRQKQIQFDETFAFNFYDLDFCQTCREAGLKLGTWPIAVTHDSIGNFDTNEWESSLRKYQQKWKHVLDRLEKPSRRTRSDK